MNVQLIPVHQCHSIDGPLSMPITGKSGKVYYVSGLFSERHRPNCECLGFRYSKGTIQSCEHIEKAMSLVCGWHSQYSKEIQSEDQESSGICPRCLEHTVTVMFGRKVIQKMKNS